MKIRQKILAVVLAVTGALLIFRSVVWAACCMASDPDTGQCISPCCEECGCQCGPPLEPGVDPKPDNSGCGANEYLCCHLNPRGIKRCNCCLCGDLNVAPTNLTATPVSETSVRLDWTPSPSSGTQHVQWTNNPSYYGQCNILSSGNPCSYAYDIGQGTNTYTLTGLTPGTRYWIQVQGTVASGQGAEKCPWGEFMSYIYYPPVCWMTPESAELLAGENTALMMDIYGGTVDRVSYQTSLG